MRAVFITAIFSVLLLSSCREPNKWPIPQLTVPSGAAPARISSEFIPPEFAMHMTSDGSAIKEGPNVYSWMRGFNYALGWDSLVKKVEGALLPLGYKPDSYGMETIPDIPGVAPGTVGRAWVAPDGMYYVVLFNVSFIKDRAPGFVGADDANYILAIDQAKDLPGELQAQFDSAAP